MSDVELITETRELGQELARRRHATGMGITDVAREARISSRYIRALETGDWHEFSAKVYAYGALKRFIVACGIEDSDMLLDAFGREWDHRYGSAVKKESRIFTPAGTVRRVRGTPRLTPRLIGIGTASLALILISAFWGTRLVAFAAPPGLAVDAPADLSGYDTAMVTVGGHTEKESRLTVNGRELTLDERGAFHEDIELPSGVTELRFISHNRFGKEHVVTRHIFIR